MHRRNLCFRNPIYRGGLLLTALVLASTTFRPCPITASADVHGSSDTALVQCSPGRSGRRLGTADPLRGHG
jgi:hypothetical protein